MRFQNWLSENEDMTPASAEVIRTGLQPQVGANTSEDRQRQVQEQMEKLDQSIERLRNLVIGLTNNEQSRSAVKLCLKFYEDWQEIKRTAPNSAELGLGSLNPGDRQLDYMQSHQPLPEDPRAVPSVNLRP